MYWKAIGPHRFKLNNLINFGGKYIYSDGEQSMEYIAVCDRSTRKLINNVSIVVALIIISHLLFVAGPFYAYFSQDIRITPMATELPFLEKGSTHSFFMNLLQQFIVAMFTLSGNIAIEIMHAQINDTITITPQLIHLDLRQLENELHRSGMCLKVKARLRNVLIKVQDFDR